MNASQIRPFLIDVLIKKGMYAFEAEIVADRMLDAETIGYPHQGCASLKAYVRSVDLGDIDPRAIAFDQSTSAATQFINANEGMGQVAATKGMQSACEKARQTGIGLVVIGNSQSLGCPLVYARLAALDGLIGLCLTSTAEKFVASEDPFADLLGQLPAAFAVPFSGKSIGYEFASAKTDAATAPTSVQVPPLLTASFSFLHAVLTCGLTGERIPSEKTRGPLLERTEHLFVAIAPEVFAGADALEKRVGQLVDYFKQTGQPLAEHLLTEESEFELPAETLESLQEIAVKEKIAWPFSQ